MQNVGADEAKSSLCFVYGLLCCVSFQSDFSVCTVLTYQEWTSTSASGTSSPGPSVAAQ